MRTTDLLNNNEFFSALVNGPCQPENRGFQPVRSEWIDDAASTRITEVLKTLLPSEDPYTRMVKVERNPDTIINGTAVDDSSKLTRYIVITLLPDTEYPYDINFPLIQGLGVLNLISWELCRAAIAASKESCRILIKGDPHLPILNSARVEWVSLYIGRRPFTGIDHLHLMNAELDTSEADVAKGGNEVGKDEFDHDTHLFNLRALDDPLCEQLAAAYDEDFPEKETLSHE